MSTHVPDAASPLKLLSGLLGRKVALGEGGHAEPMAAAAESSRLMLEKLSSLLQMRSINVIVGPPGEDSLRPVTRLIVGSFEGLMFGTGLTFGLMRRPPMNP